MSDVIEPTTALATIETINPALVFVPGGAESLLSRIEREAREQAANLDISTEKGRKAIASLSYKVARSKTALDAAGKDLKAEWLAKSNAVDAERRIIRERLEALSDEVRKPLTEWEEAEKARISRNESAISALEALGHGLGALSSNQIAERQQQVGLFRPEDWSIDFVARAQKVHSATLALLKVGHQDALHREAEAAAEAQRRVEEAERQRQAAEQAQREREERIAAEAAERARKEAEAKAERERLAAEAAAQAERDAAARREREAHEAAERAEAARVAAEAKAEREKQEAAQRADREKAEAVEAERRRQVAEAERQKREDERRAADKAHRGQVNREVMAALVGCGLGEDLAKTVISSIVRSEIPHVSIRY